MTGGGGKQQAGRNKDKRQRGERGTEAGWLKNSWLSTLLSPAGAQEPRPCSSPEFHSCQGPGRAGAGHRGPGRSRCLPVLYTTSSQTGLFVLCREPYVCHNTWTPFRLCKTPGEWWNRTVMDEWKTDRYKVEINTLEWLITTLDI